MNQIRISKQLQAKLQLLRQKGKTIGFVPTMGALHEGHLSLVRASVKKNNITVVSIFVNPTQFGPNEDLKKYPRQLKNDLKLLRNEGVHYVFTPSTHEIYSKETVCSVKLNAKASSWLTQSLCGKHRPGHFDGVTTVVAKLFNIIGPCQAYFGAKDWQQTRVIQQLIADFKFPVQLKVLPVLREKDDLAMSSRNLNLSGKEREWASFLPRILKAAKKKTKGKDSLEKIKQIAIWDLKHVGLKPQYLEFVDAKTLEPLQRRRQGMRLMVACFAGKTRLIDNIKV